MIMKFVPGKGSAGAARSGMKMLEKYRTKESATGKLSRGKLRNYFVKGTITVKTQYLTTTSKTKERKVVDLVYEDKEKYSANIAATSKQEAEKQFIQRAQDEFNVDAAAAEDSRMFKNATVSNVDVNFVDEVSEARSKSEADTPMRKATPVKYGFIPEDAKHQKNEGFCVCR